MRDSYSAALIDFFMPCRGAESEARSYFSRSIATAVMAVTPVVIAGA